MHHPVNLICMNSNTVFRTENSSHVSFLNYIITTSNKHWLQSQYYLVCVDGIPRKSSNFSIRLPINCGYIQLGKNAKNVSHIQNSGGGGGGIKEEDKVFLESLFAPPDPLHSVPQETDLLKYIIKCPVPSIPSGRPMGIVKKGNRKVRAPWLLGSHLSPAAPFEKRALLHLKWPALHNSFWFHKPLWPHITFIFREGNLLVERFWDCALIFVVFWESSHFFLTHHFIKKPSLNERNLSVLSIFCCLIQQLIPVVSWETYTQNGIMRFSCS